MGFVMGRWYATVTFVGELSAEQMLELCGVDGPAVSASSEDDRVTLKFSLNASGFEEAYVLVLGKLKFPPLFNLIRVFGVLSQPVAFQLEDEQRRQERMNVEMGLPRATPAEEAGQILLDRLAKLPPATAEDRARWLVEDEKRRAAAFPSAGDVSTCAVCKGGIRYQDCPTGGWWIHDTHPADGHDAKGDESSKQPGCTCWSTNDKHSMSCRLADVVEVSDAG